MEEFQTPSTTGLLSRFVLFFLLFSRASLTLSLLAAQLDLLDESSVGRPNAWRGEREPCELHISSIVPNA